MEVACKSDVIFLLCFQVNLNEQGKLLRQEEFLLIEDNGKKALKRRIFLFEELILLSIPSKVS